MTDTEETLTARADRAFAPLTDAERQLLDSTADNDPPGLNFVSGDPPEPGSDSACSIRATLLRWLLADPDVSADHRGLSLRGVVVTGLLDLSRCRIATALAMHNCRIDTGLDLRETELRALDLRGCVCGRIDAEGLTVTATARLDGVLVERGVDLKHATIGGNLTCMNAHLTAANGVALAADQITVGGDVALDDMTAFGRIAIAGATVSGDLGIPGARLRHRRERALNADRISVGGHVNLASMRAAGQVSLRGARVGGSIEAGGSVFVNRDGDSLTLYRAEIGGNVLLNDRFGARGQVNLLGASVNGVLLCSRARMQNRGGCALRLDSASIDDDVFLFDGFRAEGRVDLTRAKLGGSLRCDGGAFINGTSTALHAVDLHIDGNAALDHARFVGEVCLYALTAHGDVQAQGARFLNRSRQALNLERAQIGGGLFLNNGCRVYGLVRAVGARVRMISAESATFRNRSGGGLEAVALFAPFLEVTTGAYFGNGFRTNAGVMLDNCRIDGDLSFFRCVFRGDAANGLVARTARIGGEFNWCELETGPLTELNLSSSSVGLFVDNVRSWPAPGHLHIDGLTYHGIAPDDGAIRERWLGRLPEHQFLSQPYEQLASVLRACGRERHAIRIGMAKQDARRRRGKLGMLPRAWATILKVTIGYGYKPQRALFWSLLFIVAGALAFAAGHRAGLMIPEEGSADPAATLPASQPTFSALGYSLDVFLPIVDLNLASRWQPSERTTCQFAQREVACGRWLGILTRIQILFGWLLTTLAVAGVSGLIRRD